MKLQLLFLTIALAGHLIAVPAKAELWTSLMWTPSSTVLCPSLPLSTSTSASSLAMVTSPSSLPGRGLWFTRGAYSWADTSQWWNLGMQCRLAAGWTDAALHVIHGWDVTETATIAASATLNMQGATGFPWHVRADCSVALLWQGWQDTWLACTVRNAMVLPQSTTAAPLELRLGIRHEINNVVVTADVLQHANSAMALIAAASYPVVPGCSAGIVLRTLPQAMRIWTSVDVEPFQGVMLGVDVSVLGWSPMLSYTHAL